jgi:hypothetical protein
MLIHFHVETSSPAERGLVEQGDVVAPVALLFNTIMPPFPIG